MSELKVHLYQASFNPSHPCRGGTTNIILLNYISVPLLLYACICVFIIEMMVNIEGNWRNYNSNNYKSPITNVNVWSKS